MQSHSVNLVLKPRSILCTKLEIKSRICTSSKFSQLNSWNLAIIDNCCSCYWLWIIYKQENCQPKCIEQKKISENCTDATTTFWWGGGNALDFLKTIWLTIWKLRYFWVLVSWREIVRKPKFIQYFCFHTFPISFFLYYS